MPNWTYDPDAKDVAEQMQEAESFLEERSDAYIQGVRDALMWVLGLEDKPIQ